MSMTTGSSTAPLIWLRTHLQPAGGQVRTAFNRGLRIFRITSWRTGRRLHKEWPKLVASLKRFDARAAGEQAKWAFKRGVRILRVTAWRITRRLRKDGPRLVAGLKRFDARAAGGQAKTAFNNGARILRITAWRADRRLHRDWPQLFAALRRFGGRPEMQGVLLGVFAMGAAFFLATANLGTREAIAERAAEDLRYSLSQVVPAAHHDNNLAGDVGALQDKIEGQISFHRARMGKKVTAVAFEMIGPGYTGGIKVLLGIDTEGRLLGVRVLSHAETPGLGDKIEVQKSDWILGFDGLSLGNPPVAMWKVKKDGGQFDQFSGATITPRAVVDAIRRGLELFRRNRGKLLDIAGKSKKEA